jgi:threonine synthase
MKFTSRSGGEVGFREALFAGLAPGGGLFHPVERPDLSPLFKRFNEDTPFAELASATAADLFSPEIDAEAAERIVSRAYSFQPVLRRLDEKILLLELFHGPTCAFKDFGAQFLAAAMEGFLHGESRRIQILVATSGDTGSAVAHAFHGREGIDVVILYPSGRVTELQEKQLTTLGGNVHALEVKGSFDDCQRLTKEAFQDESLRARLSLTSANSINIGRLLPQCFYYIYAMTRRKTLADRPTAVCVPSGNFGNLTAGVYARLWGLPVRAFIAGTNINDVVPKYLSTGLFAPRASVKTLSNAMDVGNPSNFERLQEVFHGDLREMRSVIHGIAMSDAKTRESMREIHRRYGVFADPHTAVGYAAAREYLKAGSVAGRGARRDEQVVVLSTAHPAKFLDIVQESVGAEPPIPERLARCLTLPKRSTIMGRDLAGLSRFLLDSFGK